VLHREQAGSLLSLPVFVWWLVWCGVRWSSCAKNARRCFLLPRVGEAMLRPLICHAFQTHFSPYTHIHRNQSG